MFLLLGPVQRWIVAVKGREHGMFGITCHSPWLIMLLMERQQRTTGLGVASGAAL
jgi:hypothetical protein